MAGDDVRYEEFRVNGEAMIAKVKEILRESNVRRLIIKDEKGTVLIEVPLTVGVVGGVVGVMLLPVWAALGAIAALAANLTIVVEKIGEPASQATVDVESKSGGGQEQP